MRSDACRGGSLITFPLLTFPLVGVWRWCLGRPGLSRSSNSETLVTRYPNRGLPLWRIYRLNFSSPSAKKLRSESASFVQLFGSAQLWNRSLLAPDGVLGSGDPVVIRLQALKGWSFGHCHRPTEVTSFQNSDSLPTEA